MPKLTLSMFEPIEVEIIGVGLFKIETLSSEMLGDFQAAVKGFSEKPDEVTPKQLGGVLVPILPGITLEQAMKVDFRHILRIASFLAKQISEATQPDTAKN